MTKFEVFGPVRRGRSSPGNYLRLVTNSNTVMLRPTRAALGLIGIDPKHGDRTHFLIEVDRDEGSIRLTPTDNVAQGRMMNATNLQIAVGKKFLEWTGWGECRWELREDNGALVGDRREEINLG